MPGTKGHSGGSRPGAGQKPKTRTLRLGQQLLFHLHDADDRIMEMPQMAEVESMTRTQIVLRLENGQYIRLGY